MHETVECSSWMRPTPAASRHRLALFRCLTGQHSGVRVLWYIQVRGKTDSCNDTATKCFGLVTEPQLSASRVTLPLHFFFARCARTHGNRHVVTCRPYVPVAHLTVCGPHVGWGAVYTAAGHSYHSHSKQHAHVHVLDRSLSSNSRLRGGGTCCVQMCTAQRACAGHTKITRRAGQW